MDLISSFTIIDWVAGVSAVMILGTFSSNLVSLVSKLWAPWATNPIVQSVVNNTLVFLKDTEVMWRPVLNMSLTILTPLREKALMILTPFGTLGLVVADTFVRGIVLLSLMTFHLVIAFVDGVYQFVNLTKSMGLDVVSSLRTVGSALKDFTVSSAKIINWIGYILYKSVSGLTFVLDSFDQCGHFLHRVLFEAHKLTWNDVYNISIPFLVVVSILSMFVWRMSKRFASTPVDYGKKYDDECVIPRRSSRLARKRALLYCHDLSSPMLTSQKSSSTTAHF